MEKKFKKLIERAEKLEKEAIAIRKELQILFNLRGSHKKHK